MYIMCIHVFFLLFGVSKLCSEVLSGSGSRNHLENPGWFNSRNWRWIPPTINQDNVRRVQVLRYTARFWSRYRVIVLFPSNLGSQPWRKIFEKPQTVSTVHGGCHCHIMLECHIAAVPSFILGSAWKEPRDSPVRADCTVTTQGTTTSPEGITGMALLGAQWAQVLMFFLARKTWLRHHWAHRSWSVQHISWNAYLEANRPPPLWARRNEGFGCFLDFFRLNWEKYSASFHTDPHFFQISTSCLLLPLKTKTQLSVIVTFCTVTWTCHQNQKGATDVLLHRHHLANVIMHKEWSYRIIDHLTQKPQFLMFWKPKTSCFADWFAHLLEAITHRISLKFNWSRPNLAPPTLIVQGRHK